MAIIRLCRTFPRKNSPGIGLHCFHFTKNIQIKTVIFTKFESDEITELPDHALLFEIRYSDLNFARRNESFLRTIAIYLSKAIAESIFFITVLMKLISKKIPITLIHLHSINHIFSAVLLKIIYQKPLVINFGGTDLVRVKDKAWLRFLVRRSDKVLFVSKSMEKVLLEFLDEAKILYVGNGVDLDFFQPENPTKLNQLVAIGNLRWQKGYQYLIEAVGNVVKSNTDIRLLIVGEGKDRQEIEALIRKLNLYDFVSLRGACSRDEVRKILNESYLYICSSISEGLPKALLEAIATETPVIVTDVGDCKDVAYGVGITVNSASSEKLADAILELTSNPKLYEQFVYNCRKKRFNYGWESMINKVKASYSEFGIR